MSETGKINEAAERHEREVRDLMVTLISVAALAASVLWIVVAVKAHQAYGGGNLDRYTTADTELLGLAPWAAWATASSVLMLAFTGLALARRP